MRTESSNNASGKKDDCNDTTVMIIKQTIHHTFSLLGSESITTASTLFLLDMPGVRPTSLARGMGFISSLTHGSSTFASETHCAL
jgi:hypothetical protein